MGSSAPDRERRGIEPSPRRQPPSAVPRNGLERWYCDSWDERRQQRCTALLMEVAIGSGYVRIKCPKCNTWHTRGG